MYQPISQNKRNNQNNFINSTNFVGQPIPGFDEPTSWPFDPRAQSNSQQQVPNTGVLSNTTSPQFYQTTGQSPIRLQAAPNTDFYNTNKQNIENNKIKQLERKNKELEKDIQELKIELENNEKEQKAKKQQFMQQISNLQKDKVDLEIQNNLLNQELEKLRRQLGLQNISLQQQKQQIQSISQEIESISQEKEKLNQSFQNERLQTQSLREQNSNIFQEFNNINNKQKKIIEVLERDNQMLEDNLKQQTDLKQQANEKIAEISREVEKEKKNFLEAHGQIVNNNRQIQELKENINQLKESEIETQKVIRETKNKVTEQFYQIQHLNSAVEQKQQEINIIQKNYDNMSQLHIQSVLQIKEENEKNLIQIKNEINYKQKEEIVNEDIAKIQINEIKQEQKQEIVEEEIKLVQVNQKNQEQSQEIKHQKQMVDEQIDQFQQKQKVEKETNNVQANTGNNQKLNKYKIHLEEAIRQQGQLDVCFLVDTTASMDSYKEQAKLSVEGALKAIKEASGRDMNCAAICYQDKAEKEQLEGKYHEFPFSKDQIKLQEWFDTIKCSGGGDNPEDIQGAIEQMNQLHWPDQNRIAILICDAPCHGKQYHDDTRDDHPDDDIRNALEKMIDKNITFIGLNFTDSTTKMFEEFKKIFQEKGKSNNFLQQDLQDIEEENFKEEIITCLKDASKKITFINDKQTKSKKELQNAE